MAQAGAKVSGVVVPHAPKWYQRLGAWIIFALIRVVSATLRYKWTDVSGYFSGKVPPGPTIYCAWHNRLSVSMMVYYNYIKKHNRTDGFAVMVSASKDGGFLAAILECFGVQPARGSSSRRGPQALRELTSWARRGYDIAITPDGPRGPRYVVQEGVLALAQLTELPVVPISYNLSWKICLNSWDKFQIPLPFSRCEVIFETPIRIPRSTSEAGREKFRQHLERVLKDISKD
jgi:lysophospholipid acyltransferase (LPLAT)-like uncharacterized protein